MILKMKNQEINIIKAETFFARLRGLMGVSPIYYGMLFPNCNGIHTFFMKENIDVIGCNEFNQVIYLYRNLPKNQIIKINYPIQKTSILELPVNASKDISMGDTLFFEDKDII